MTGDTSSAGGNESAASAPQLGSASIVNGAAAASADAGSGIAGGAAADQNSAGGVGQADQNSRVTRADKDDACRGGTTAEEALESLPARSLLAVGRSRKRAVAATLAVPGHQSPEAADLLNDLRAELEVLRARLREDFREELERQAQRSPGRGHDAKPMRGPSATWGSRSPSSFGPSIELGGSSVRSSVFGQRSCESADEEARTSRTAVVDTQFAALVSFESSQPVSERLTALGHGAARASSSSSFIGTEAEGTTFSKKRVGSAFRGAARNTFFQNGRTSKETWAKLKSSTAAVGTPARKGACLPLPPRIQHADLRAIRPYDEPPELLIPQAASANDGASESQAPTEPDDECGRLLTRVSSWLRLWKNRVSLQMQRASCTDAPEHLRKWLGSSSCDYFFGMLVALNAAMLGVQTDWQARNVGSDLPTGFFVVEVSFCIIFVAEFLLRAWAKGADRFRREELKRTVLDTVLVAAQLMEIVLDYFRRQRSISLGAAVLLRVPRFFRMLRLLRMMSIVRRMSHIGELWTMFTTIASSMRSFLWAVIMMFVLVYVIGVYLTQLVADHRVDDISESRTSKELVLYWGSLGDAMLSLYLAITGGVDWGVVAGPLHHDISVYLMPIFMIYIAFASFCVMNVITGIFVEAALLTARSDKEELLKHQIEALFHQADVDDSGCVTWDEFVRVMGTTAMAEVFIHWDMDASEIQSLFKALDVDKTGSIDIKEFTAGCNRLRGPAKSLDFILLYQEIEKLYDGYKHLVALLDKAVESRASLRAWYDDADEEA